MNSFVQIVFVYSYVKISQASVKAYVFSVVRNKS